MASVRRPAGGDGRQARWDTHNQTRRQKIIDAAVAAIEESEPGADVHVQQIAAKAGLSRTVIYRHFEDRADLDRAVQQSILDSLWAELMPAVTLEGTVPEIIRRIIGTYVRWAVAHPSLHLAADHDAGADGPLERRMEQLATEIAEVVGVAVAAFGAEPSEEQASSIDPMVFGLIGAVFSAVRRWLTRPERRLSADMLERMISDSAWFLIEGHARAWGVGIDPEAPVQDLLTAAIEPPAPTTAG